MNKVYDRYKSSPEKWLPQIPAHWQTVFLSSLFDEHKQKNVGMISTNLLSLSYGRIIRKDINGKSGLLPESFETYNVIQPNDIVLRLTDLQNDHRSLRTGLSRDEGIVTSAYVTLRRRSEKINAAYYRYYLHVFDLHKGFYGMGNGVRQSLSFDGIKKLTLLVPSDEEQKKIVGYLDYQSALINKLIQYNKKKIGLLVENLNRRFIETEKSEKRVKLKYLVKQHQDFIEPDPQTLYKKAGMYNRGRGIFTREPMLGADLGTSSFQWIKPNCLLISGQFAWEGATYLTTDEDTDALISHRYYLLEVDSDLINPEYLWAYFMSDEGRMILDLCSHGAAGRNKPLNIRELLNVAIPLPSSKESLTSIGDAARIIMSYRSVDSKQTELLEEYKASLISAVVTGQIDIRDVEIPEYEFVDEDADADSDNDDDSEDTEEQEE